jgi:hypothetical protein
MRKTQGRPERESPTRRGFIKSVTAGAVAAAGLAAGSAAGIAPRPAAAETGAAAVGTRHLQVVFNQARETTLEDVREAVGKLMDITSCTRCGFDGLDLRLQKGDIVWPPPPPEEPDPTRWVATTLGSSGF